jgi:Mg-chelatase subunit ChlD
MLLPRVRFLFSVLFLLFVFAPEFSAQTENPRSPAPSPTPPGDVERVETEEIKLNISAFDASGEFVRDVGTDDLVIVESGRLHQPTSVRRTSANVLILLDVGSEIAYAKRAKTTIETARSLIGALQENDSVAVMQYGDKVEILFEWTKDKDAVLQSLDEKKLGFGKRSAFFYALDKAVNYFRNASADNRHLVIISDGVDSFNDKQAKDATLKNLLSSDVNIHVVSYTRLQQKAIEGTKKNSSQRRKQELPPGAEPPVRGTTPTFSIGSINLDREMVRKRKEQAAQLERSEQFLTSIAEDTNGEIFLPETTQEMIEKMTQLAKNIDSQYVVTYTPKKTLNEAPDGEVRLIEANSRRAGLAVQGRRKLVVTNNSETRRNLP